MRLSLLLLTIPTLVTGFAASNKQQRQPWEVGRFIQQSSKFVKLPFTSSTTKQTIAPGDSLWPSASSNDNLSFGPLDDVVMGGASRSNFDNASGIWKGEVTDANNGGFIGIRSFPIQNWDMSGCSGIQLTLKSDDDLRLKVVMRDSTDFNGICWTTSVNVGSGSGSSNSNNPVLKLFDNKSDSSSTTVKIPFDKQIPTLFAKTVLNETFNTETVTGVQLAYSKFEYDGDLNPKFQVGDVELQILEIKAY